VKIKLSYDGEVLRTRSRAPWWLLLLGSGFLLAGMVMIADMAGLLPSDHTSKTETAIGWLMGLAFGPVGAAFVLGRSGLVIDRRAQTIIKWRGVLVPMWRVRYRLSDFDRIVIGHEVGLRQISWWRRDTYITYPIRLAGRKTPIELETPEDYDQARRQCEQLARFCGYRLEDRSSGKAVVLDPDDLDRPLRDRRGARGGRKEIPPAPATMQTRARVGRTSVVLEIPPAGMSRAMLALMIAGIVGLAVVAALLAALALADDDPTDVIAGIAFAAIIPSVIALIIIGIPMWHWCKRQRVTAGADYLRLEEELLFLKRSVVIPADEIEEVTVVRGPVLTSGARMHAFVWYYFRSGYPSLSEPDLPKGCIRARSDRKTITFGVGLPREELEWIQTALESVLSA